MLMIKMLIKQITLDCMSILINIWCEREIVPLGTLQLRRGNFKNNIHITFKNPTVPPHPPLVWPRRRGRFDRFFYWARKILHKIIHNEIMKSVKNRLWCFLDEVFFTGRGNTVPNGTNCL